jgi:hypothetical protein
MTKNIGHTTNDDLYFYFTEFARNDTKNLFFNAIYGAVANGRLTHFLLTLSFIFSQYFDSWFVIRVLSISVIVINFGVVNEIVSKICGRKQIIIFLLLISFFRVEWDHYLSSAYPASHTVFFFFISLSFYFLLSCFEQVRPQQSTLILSVFLLNLGLSGYEAFYVFAPLYWMLAIYLLRNRTDYSEDKIYLWRKRSLGSIILIYTPFLIFTQGILYLLFKVFIGKNSYEGANIAKDFNFFSFLKVLVNYSFNSFPSVGNIFDFPTSWSFLTSAPFLLSISIFLLWCFYEIRNRQLIVFKFSIKTHCTVVFLILYLIISPNFLVALTSKYQQWVLNGSRLYVTSFFSTIGHSLLVFYIYSLVLNFIKNFNLKRSFIFLSGVTLLMVTFQNYRKNISILKEQEVSRYFERSLKAAKNFEELNFIGNWKCLKSDSNFHYKTLYIDHFSMQKYIARFYGNKELAEKGGQCHSDVYEFEFNYNVDQQKSMLEIKYLDDIYKLELNSRAHTVLIKNNVLIHSP